MTLTVKAPDGAEFVFEKVKDKNGTRDLGEVPILCYRTLNALVEKYGEEGIVNTEDGTSLRVSFQGIARRMKAKGKTDDEIGQAQLDFKPGTREVGIPTPASRAAKAAKQASEKVDGDVIAALLDKVAKGELSLDDIKSLI